MAVGEEVVRMLANVLNEAGFGPLAREGRRIAINVDDDPAGERALARDFLDLVKGRLVDDPLCLHELTTDKALHSGGGGPVEFIEPETAARSDGDDVTAIRVEQLDEDEVDALFRSVEAISEAIDGLRDLVAEDDVEGLSDDDR